MKNELGKKLQLLREYNLWATLRLQWLRQGDGALKVWGSCQHHLARSSHLSLSGKNHLGYPTLGTASVKRDTTVLSLASKSQLHLSGAMIGRGCSLAAHRGAKISIGHGTYLADNSKVYSSQEITIGSNCSLSWEVTLFDSDGHDIGQRQTSAPIQLGDHVWVGCGAKILKGVQLGEHCVVAAGAVVTRSFPKGSVIGGVPARLIRSAKDLGE